MRLPGCDGVSDAELLTAKAKALLRTEQAVLALWLEGHSGDETAERLGVSPASVDYLRRHLQLTKGRGRMREVRLVVEVR